MELNTRGVPDSVVSSFHVNQSGQRQWWLLRFYGYRFGKREVLGIPNVVVNGRLCKAFSDN